MFLSPKPLQNKVIIKIYNREASTDQIQINLMSGK